MTLKDEVCPMFEEPCRHCSIDKAFGSYTKVVIDPKTQTYKQDGSGVSEMVLGERCNNDGKSRVADLKCCPARWGLTRPAKEEVKIKKPNVTRTGRYKPTAREAASGVWNKNGRRVKRI